MVSIVLFLLVICRCLPDDYRTRPNQKTGWPPGSTNKIVHETHRLSLERLFLKEFNNEAVTD